MLNITYPDLSTTVLSIECVKILLATAYQINGKLAFASSPKIALLSITLCLIV